MYIAGLIHGQPGIENLAYLSTALLVGTTVYQGIASRKHAKTQAGDPQPYRRSSFDKAVVIAQPLSFLMVPTISVVPWLFNSFRQPEWMSNWSLQEPGFLNELNVEVCVKVITVLRLSGLLINAGAFALHSAAISTMGSQWGVIGVREKPKLISDGPFAYIRNPIYTAAGLNLLGWTLLHWSYIPLTGLVTHCVATYFKIRLEERVIEESDLGLAYVEYKKKVPWRVIPYIW